MFGLFLYNFVLFFGLHFVFWPMHELGLLSFPRRITDYPLQFIYNIHFMTTGILLLFTWVCVVGLFGFTLYMYDYYLFCCIGMVYGLGNFYNFNMVLIFIYMIKYSLFVYLLHMVLNYVLNIIFNILYYFIDLCLILL